MKMKKVIHHILFAASIFFQALHPGQSNAQPYSNSWINFGNTYFKFKIAQDGVYRITKSQLDAMGMGAVSGSQFAVFREGAEVPIYTSTNGAFGSNDYIEFYAGKADGKMDAQMYIDPSFQPNQNMNLISDTAYYFLTFDNNVHQRLQLVSNAIPAPAPPISPYCMVTVYPTQNPRANWCPGQSRNLAPIAGGGYFYSSDYDLAEGYAYTGLTQNVTLTIPTPQIAASGPSAVVSFVTEGHSVTATQHHPVVLLNNVNIFDSILPSGQKFKMIKRSVNVSPGQLTASNALKFTDVFNFFALTSNIRYPRTYNFSAVSNKAAFEVAAADRYLEITGFNTGGQAPLLYDRTNSKVYTGTESGGVLKFYLDASVLPRGMFLTNIASVGNIAGFNPVQFRDYGNTANQGDYIILSHKNYINASPNYVGDYKTYRNSAAGGSHQSVIVDVTELYDQFAYGYDFNPLSVKNFIAYANGTWTTKPKFMFIIGKGVGYTNYRNYMANPGLYSYSPVPTWGEPGADNLLSSYNNSEKPILATGRLSAWNNDEIGRYLTKVQAYEEAIRPLAVPTVEHEFWKKKALHIAGSSDINLQNQLVASLNICQGIFEDTLIGGQVRLARKTTTDPIDQGTNVLIDSVMNNGLGYVSFYGHGSSAGFDYNLNLPDNYNSKPRFPIFSSFACEVAHIFGLTTLDKTISEKYVISEKGGSIIMIAGNNTGWTSDLPRYMQNLYRSWGYKAYGKTVGEQYQKNIEYLQDNFTDVFTDIHTQSLLFQGDPGITAYNPEKIDFAVEANGISSNPVNVTTALNSFQIKAIVYNLAKATNDSVWVRLQHTRPGNMAVLYADSVKLPSLKSSDTLFFTVPLDPNADIGTNNYTIKVDAADKYDELSEDNNQATLQIFIYSENLVPVYPKEFAIVHQQGVTLKASTLNAFAPMRAYRLEMDTTEYFNSALKQSTIISSKGGVIKWTPTITYQDSVVYYWRCAPDEMINGAYAWNYSSFIYLANGSDGWNQSHFFQYKKDEPFTALEISEATGRKFKYAPVLNMFDIRGAVIYLQLQNYLDNILAINDVRLQSFGCNHTGSLYIAVVDSITGKPWLDPPSGTMGSVPACWTDPREVFEFNMGTAVSRNNARLFLESIPNGNYIAIQNQIESGFPTPWNGQTATQWRQDSAIYGGQSLYHTLKNMGFDQIDQFTSKKAFAFFMKKGYPATVQQDVGIDSMDKVQVMANFYSYQDTGVVQTELVGPALEWQTLKWRTSAADNVPVNDSPYVAVYGVDVQHNETLLYSGFARDTSLSFISAAQYPNLRLKWYSVDNINRTSPQLNYWRVLYSPVPEAALNAALFLEHKDTLGPGEQGHLKIAIENLTLIPMDSMLVSYKVIDVNGVKHNLADKKYKKLLGNDTLIASLDYDAISYPGKNFLFIEANPNNDQPEQYHPNNLGYLNLFSNSDKYNPLLDVTFDGIHILDKDIVSAKPLIKVLMTDENKYLPLNDTALMKLQLLYPNQSTPVDIPFDGTICKFFPAQIVNGRKNESRVEYKPTQLEDGLYRLIVSGKDKSGNIAGNAPKYEVNFTVENKPTITNVLNYPNPFSTATQFIFTLTGSEVPSQFKIQILTVTGKVIREIKKNELGNLHIGRNITDYRWDGKDEYGQMLGNGVYLYRVVTSIRGEEIEHRKNTSVDKFFKNGYGKLYIMR